jgi:hypothetical protein
MSLILSLEVENLTRECLLDAALASGAAAATDDSSGQVAEFPVSGLEVLVRSSSGSDQVLTEGLDEPATWRVGMRVSLRYALDRYDECNRDVRRLLENLATRSSSSFVLSFQNESAYAVRDEGGLRFFPGSGLE